MTAPSIEKVAATVFWSFGKREIKKQNTFDKTGQKKAGFWLLQETKQIQLEPQNKCPVRADRYNRESL